MIEVIKKVVRAYEHGRFMKCGLDTLIRINEKKCFIDCNNGVHGFFSWGTDCVAFADTGLKTDCVINIVLKYRAYGFVFVNRHIEQRLVMLNTI